jgi:predicted DNA-binding transcriptional regulator AlpA
MAIKQTPAQADNDTGQEQNPRSESGIFFDRDINRNASFNKKEGDMVQFITLSDLAQILRVKRSTVYQKHRKWESEGLTSFNLDGSKRFLANDVIAWMQKRKRVFVGK